MSFLTKIKFGNITNLSDARFAAAAGVDYMGFCFDPANVNYIPPIKAKEIIDWTTGSYIIAEFADQTTEEINTISELLDIDMIELENNLFPEELKTLNKVIIKKIDVNAFDKQGLQNEIAAYKPVSDIFHLYASGNEYKYDFNELTEVCKQFNVIWGFHMNKENIVSVIDLFKPYAINISGGAEEKTGLKDFDEMNDLLDMISDENQ